MSARIVLVIFNIFDLIWSRVKAKIAKIQRDKKLPDEVADIYDAERYQTFLDYKADNSKMMFIKHIINFVIDTSIILSPIYTWIENLANKNVYLVVIVNYLFLMIIEKIVSIPFSYYNTFVIQEKYKQNKMTKKTFVKDTIVSIILENVMMIVLLEIFTCIAFGLKNLSLKIHLGYGKGFLVCLAVAAGIFLIIFLLLLIQLVSLRIQYKFTPLEDGELKDKINKLQESSKKKVKKIYVYNESKKSVSKNAFLLKLFWYREFGIADNFINENSERELLAVLSHEVGHLKHKKDFIDYLGYVELVILFVLMWLYVADPGKFPIIEMLNNWVMRSFDITVPNYYVILFVLLSFGRPLFALFGLFTNYRQRKEEYEADQEAVKNGYGEELIETFKRMSSDELIDINPHPLFVALYHDHPTIYQRIVAIREGIQRLGYDS
ncbi:MAG: M48 family metallopeptidase [Eubacterium sp.]|nr:M48 family metallopeptidase [Eubacterium sp.]